LYFDLKVDLVSSLLVSSHTGVGALVALLRFKNDEGAVALDVDPFAGHHRRRVGSHPGALGLRNADDHAGEKHFLLLHGQNAVAEGDDGRRGAGGNDRVHFSGALALADLGHARRPELVRLLALQVGELEVRLSGGDGFDGRVSLFAAFQGAHVDFVADDLAVWSQRRKPAHDQRRGRGGNYFYLIWSFRHCKERE